MAFTLTSSAFSEGAPIPARYSCDGADVSPPLAWRGAPAGTKSFALICDDPDAPRGTWVHWVLYNLPATMNELPEGVNKTAALRELGGAWQGLNSGKRTGYNGPCPPPGGPHRYFFKLYALDHLLKLDANSTKADVERAMDGHALSQAHVMGTYQRRASR
jgi:Raf kinase inhibitor-like YbhB/YbcL family protein